MLDRFQKHISISFPFLSERKLLLACSGGVDSMVLAHLTEACGFNFSLAHCNYKLRGRDSDKDEKFVRSWADERGIKVYTKTFDLEHYSGSIQLKAREYRYNWFKNLLSLENFHHILTAHHGDDAMETFFINLSRGTGLDGLTGIPARNKHIIRPLLPFSKQEILTFAKKNEVNWREDRSNKETKYIRNRIRHHVIPQFEGIHPEFSSNFKLTQHHLRLSGDLLRNYADLLRTKLFVEVTEGFQIAISELKQLHPLKGYLHLLFKDFGFVQWKDVENLLRAQSGKSIQSKTYRLIKDREILLLSPIVSQPPLEYQLQENDQHILEPFDLKLEDGDHIEALGPTIIYVDKEKLNYPLKLRKWKIGDYFYPFGMKGKKKLSKFFKDEKYNALKKENQWLLCSGDAIVWVVGERMDDRFKITKMTKEIIKLTCKL